MSRTSVHAARGARAADTDFALTICSWHAAGAPLTSGWAHSFGSPNERAHPLVNGRAEAGDHYAVNGDSHPHSATAEMTASTAATAHGRTKHRLERQRMALSEGQRRQNCSRITECKEVQSHESSHTGVYRARAGGAG